jgi:hypothetical protein
MTPIDLTWFINDFNEIESLLDEATDGHRLSTSTTIKQQRDNDLERSQLVIEAGQKACNSLSRLYRYIDWHQFQQNAETKQVKLVRHLDTERLISSLSVPSRRRERRRQEKRLAAEKAFLLVEELLIVAFGYTPPQEAHYLVLRCKSDLALLERRGQRLALQSKAKGIQRDFYDLADAMCTISQIASQDVLDIQQTEALVDALRQVHKSAATICTTVALAIPQVQAGLGQLIAVSPSLLPFSTAVGLGVAVLVTERRIRASFRAIKRAQDLYDIGKYSHNMSPPEPFLPPSHRIRGPGGPISGRPEHRRGPNSPDVGPPLSSPPTTNPPQPPNRGVSHTDDFGIDR